MDKIYNMKLHETLWINEVQTEVLRVAGGWIYKTFDYESQRQCTSQVFVPFNNEFID